MSGDVTPYTSLITSEHADKPNFMATVAASCQPFADIMAVLNSYPSVYDLDNAQGSQLDVIGQWVGASRYVSSPLTGVYFSFDTANLGFDEGLIWSSGEPLTGLIALPDDIYKLLIRARIVANHWNGTIPSAYTAWNDLFESSGYQIIIQDNGDMTMTLGLVSNSINPTFHQLFIGGYLDLRPAGVLINGYITPSAEAPFFGFDVENSTISGFDVGAFAVYN